MEATPHSHPSYKPVKDQPADAIDKAHPMPVTVNKTAEIIIVFFLPR